MEIIESVGLIIRGLRKSRRLLLRHVATALDIDPSFLSKIETGEKSPSAKQITQLARLFGIEEKSLLIHHLSDKLISELDDDELSLDAIRLAAAKIELRKQDKTEDYSTVSPIQNELPSQYADRVGVQYSSIVTKVHKKNNGQFFTPIEVARLMARFSSCKSDFLRILDPGCGTGILTCSLIENVLFKNPHVTEIDIVVYETDKKLIKYLNDVFSYLKLWLGNQAVALHYSIRQKDFVLDNHIYLTQNIDQDKAFDIIISNPPYFKLSKDDQRAQIAKRAAVGQSNIYSVFMAVSANLLKNDGELIFITPRSFSSGSYFKAFREFFFKHIELKRIHLFSSRKEAFGRDKVLQETVIIKGSKRTNRHDRKVLVSSSKGITDIRLSLVKPIDETTLVNLSSEEKFLFIPVNEEEEKIIALFRSWKDNLSTLKIRISTGPVVAHRSKAFIYEHFENGTAFLVPLFWLHNVNKMRLDWPIAKPQKGQYIRMAPESQSRLLPNKNYIFLRRFSSKEDKSRLIASPYFSTTISTEYFGLENKVNYIHRPRKPLENEEMIGLCALLNSSLFDNFFRIFNGNVNVSATELKSIPLPPIKEIKAIGKSLIDSADYSGKAIDTLVAHFFEIEKQNI